MKNYQVLKYEILQNLLDEHSSSAISRKLGYKFDQVKRWSQGSKQLKWNEFCDLCEVLKVPLAQTLRLVFGFNAFKKSDTVYVSAYLRTLFVKESVKSLAEKLSISESNLKRVLANKVIPDFEFVLELMDFKPDYLNQFVEAITSKENIASKAQQFGSPWSSAICDVLRTQEYLDQSLHSNEFIAKYLNLPTTVIEKSIAELIKLDYIFFEGSLLKPRFLTKPIFNRNNVEEICQFTRFWTERALKRFQTKSGMPINRHKGPNSVAFRLFAASAESALKVTQIMGQAEQDIHKVLESDLSPKTDVRLVLFHHFSIQDYPMSNE